MKNGFGDVVQVHASCVPLPTDQRRFFVDGGRDQERSGLTALNRVRLSLQLRRPADVPDG